MIVKGRVKEIRGKRENPGIQKGRESMLVNLRSVGVSSIARPVYWTELDPSMTIPLWLAAILSSKDPHLFVLTTINTI